MYMGHQYSHFSVLLIDQYIDDQVVIGTLLRYVILVMLSAKPVHWWEKQTLSKTRLLVLLLRLSHDVGTISNSCGDRRPSPERAPGLSRWRSGPQLMRDGHNKHFPVNYTSHCLFHQITSMFENTVLKNSIPRQMLHVDENGVLILVKHTDPGGQRVWLPGSGSQCLQYTCDEQEAPTYSSIMTCIRFLALDFISIVNSTLVFPSRFQWNRKNPEPMDLLDTAFEGLCAGQVVG